MDKQLLFSGEAFLPFTHMNLLQFKYVARALQKFTCLLGLNNVEGAKNAEREVIHKPFTAIVSIRLHLFNISIQLERNKVHMERERVRRFLLTGL